MSDYENCMFYEYIETDYDVLSGHSSYAHFCKANGSKKKIIPFYECRKCEKAKRCDPINLKEKRPLSEFEKGYQRALEDINRSMAVVAAKWNPSECPRCKAIFEEYEPCNDGSYQRAMLDRCPHCGQKLDWDVVDR